MPIERTIVEARVLLAFEAHPGQQLTPEEVNQAVSMSGYTYGEALMAEVLQAMVLDGTLSRYAECEGRLTYKLIGVE